MNINKKDLQKILTRAWKNICEWIKLLKYELNDEFERVKIKYPKVTKLLEVVLSVSKYWRTFTDLFNFLRAITHSPMIPLAKALMDWIRDIFL